MLIHKYYKWFLCFIMVLNFCFFAIGQNKEKQFEILKYNNPGLVVDLGVGLWAWPLPMDYDGDGDMDLLVSSQGVPFNGVYYFENKSGAKNPIFAKPVWLNKSIANIQLSIINNKPRITIPGAELLNFTKTYATEKKPLCAADTIRKLIKGNVRFNQWKLVDFDADGDEDIYVGIDSWGDYGWDNAFDKNGVWKKGPLHGFIYILENVNGKYINKGKLKAENKEIDVYGAPSPNFADFDGDGDLDLICGEFLDKLTYFKNTGTKTKPTYAEGVILSNKSGLIKMDLEMIIPVSVDWNMDGNVDLVIGDEDGRVAFLENTGKLKNGIPKFKSLIYFKQEADNVKFGALPSQQTVDWDNDGDEDIISGNSAGYIAFFENLGQNKNMPKWAAPVFLKNKNGIIRIQAGYNGSIQGPAESKWGYTTLSVSDWDHDGLLDLVVNSILGKVVWYKNIGTKNKPKLANSKPIEVEYETNITPKPKWLWWEPKPKELVTQWRTTPATYDWNKDGLTDLIMMDQEGYLAYYERFIIKEKLFLNSPKRIFYSKDFAGFNNNHVVKDSTAGPLRLNIEANGPSGRRKISIADYNQDGKPDLMVNSLNVSVMYNEETKNGLTYFSFSTPLTNQKFAGHDTSPCLFKWHKNEIPGLLMSAEDGHFYLLK